MMTRSDMLPHPSRYYPALDGLRGIAIIVVLIWHYVSSWHTFFPGWAGVDLFFVLSGYLITGRLLDTKGQPGYFTRFYRNRILRIWPLYYALVIPFLLLIPYVKAIHAPTVAIYKDHWLSLLLFLQNWTFIRCGTPSDMTLVHLWSLAVEEQFYLLWPLVILLTTARGRIRIFIPLILLVLAARCIFCWYHPANPINIHYNTFFRIDALVAGSLLCQLHRLDIKIPKGWTGVIASIGLFIILAAGIIAGEASPTIPFITTIGYTLLAIVFACALHLTLQPGHPLARLCTLPSLRWMGKISYGLYIIHMPVRTIIGGRLEVGAARLWPNFQTLIGWSVPWFCFFLSLFLSVISFRYYESFFLRLKSSSRPSGQPSLLPKTENK
jgi:peptidoglycan/LPS O-acetylase OafA/YrhL